MIKTIALSWTCDVCKFIGLLAYDHDEGVSDPLAPLPLGWFNVRCQVGVQNAGDYVFVSGHACSVKCLAKLLETKIIAPFQTPSPPSIPPPQDSNT